MIDEYPASDYEGAETFWLGRDGIYQDVNPGDYLEFWYKVEEVETTFDIYYTPPGTSNRDGVWTFSIGAPGTAHSN
ncbi:MAG: hypothetical protein ACTSU5_13885 [Promethearchaeota archaeon]